MKITTLTLNKKEITDFAKERNELLKKSKTEWNLFVDNDEKINNVQFKINNYFSAYYLTRKNYFINQYIGTEKIIRLVKKNTGRFERVVHEKWIPYKKVHIGCVLNDNHIIHNTADNLAGYINKINYYSDLHAKANKLEGKKSNLFKIIFYPIGKFVVTLVKSRNVVFSIMQSLHSFLSWTKMYFRTEQN